MAKIQVILAAILEASYGFRKFMIMISLIVSGIYYLHTGKLSGREFVDLVQGTAMAFMAANSVETMGGVISDWLKKKVG